MSITITTLSDSGEDVSVAPGSTVAAEAADGDGLSLREALSLFDQAYDRGDPVDGDFRFDPSLAGSELVLANGDLDLYAPGETIRIDGDADGDGIGDITISGRRREPHLLDRGRRIQLGAYGAGKPHPD